MRTTRTVIILSEIERERALLKSLLASFGRRPRFFWEHIEEGIADVAVVSVDNPPLELIRQAQKLAKVVVFYANAADRPRLGEQAYLLDKQARARDFLGLLERLEDYFEGDAPVPAGRAAPVRVAANAAAHALAG